MSIRASITVILNSMKRVVIVHGWDGFPEDAWYPWLKAEVEKRGFQVIAPQLPNPGSPRVRTWIPALANSVGIPDEQTYFVGHSMGCQAIVRYLEELPQGQKVGGAIFVAGFFERLTDVGEDDNSHETERNWLSEKPDFQMVKRHLSKSVAIFSDDDPYVPLDNQNDFRDFLGSEIVIQHAKGHFNKNRDHTTELQIVLDKLVELAK
jgi:predicted alpha/beta hydrolase family esterase